MSGRSAVSRIEPRWKVLERLATGVFDVLVIGGGIVGSRVAYDASRAGLRVALVDAGDFAGATSGASAGLLHGGLRYLKRGDFGLVRAACREREALARRVAPHLVRPMPFVVARDGGVADHAKLVAGLSVYAALGGGQWPRPRLLTRRGAARLVPACPSPSVVPRAIFYEARVDDARLTLATVRAAVRSGAAAINHVRVRDLRLVPNGVSEALLYSPEGDLTLRARSVVNATGPWTDAVRRMENPRCRPITRLSKGVHVVLKAPEPWGAALAVHLEDGGHLYAVPDDGTLLLGTTDEEYAGDPGAVAATPQDVLRLLDRASAFLPPDTARPDAVLSAFAGLRVLPRAPGATADAPRGHVLGVGAGGMVSVAGGKLTTHRRISLDALRNLPAGVRPRGPRLDDTPLPGAPPPGRPVPVRIEDPVHRHLYRVYGDDAGRVLALAARVPGAFERVAPDAPDVWAQVYYAVGEEWALTADDVLRRRTGLAMRGLDTPAVRKNVADVLRYGVPAWDSPIGVPTIGQRRATT